MSTLVEKWPMILAFLWALDQILVSFLGKSTVLDTLTSILKSLGADKTQQ